MSEEAALYFLHVRLECEYVHVALYYTAMRRFLSIICSGFGITLASAALCATLTDVGTSSYSAAVQDLLDRGVVEGYSDGTFRPTSPINRAELLQILMKSRFPDKIPEDLRCFKDLEVRTPQWYARPVCLAQELGIVSGYLDETFRPDQTVNLAEALKMGFRSFGIVPSFSYKGAWYEPYLSLARSRNLLLPLLKNPSHLLTREEMAALTSALIAETEELAQHPSSSPAAFCGNGKIEQYEQCDDGNTQDGDGCSSICVLVSEPVRIAILQIDERASGTLSLIAQGQKHLPLLRFTATAGRQDALLTSITFSPSVGSLVFGEHYTLSMDRNGDGTYEQVVQANGKASNDSLTFDQLGSGGLLIPEGVPVPFVVTADLRSTLGPVSIGLEFATDLPDYIEAQGAVDGIALTGIETDNTCMASDCFIRVNTRASTDINILDRGNLFVTQDSTPTRSHILVGGSVSDALLRLKLRADGENIDIQTIRIDGVPSSVDSLLLYAFPSGQTFDPSRMQPIASATNGQCVDEPSTRLCAELGLSTLIVTPDEEMTLVVTAKLKNKALGAVSGESMTLSLSPATGGAVPSIEARGKFSQQILSVNDGNGTANGEVFIGISSPAPNVQISGKPNDIALASIEEIINGDIAEQNFIPSGDTTIGAFEISAIPHTNSFQGQNDVNVHTLTFTVSAQNVRLDPLGFRLRTKSDPGAFISCSAADTTGLIAISCTGIDNGTLQSHIGQGQSVTYLLSANVVNTEIVPGSSALTVTLPTLGQRTSVNSVVWSDGSTTFSWVDVPVTSVDSTRYQQR
jgi:cysteine-rich repeat protein